MIRRMQQQKGFTLIELMVAICILFILGGISAPAFSRWVPNARMGSVVRDLQSSVQRARIEAIKRNRTVCMDFDFAGDRCSVFLDDGTTDGTLDANDTLIDRLEMSRGVDFYAADSGGGPIQFNSRGMLMNSDLLKIRNAQGRYKGVAISITGKSRIVSSTDNGATWW